MELAIKKEESETSGRYVAVIEGVEAELTFSKLGTSGNIIADHTGVPSSLAGRGIAKALAHFMVKDARSNNFKIVRLCPFVKGQYQKHPEWSDVMMS